MGDIKTPAEQAEEFVTSVWKASQDRCGRLDDEWVRHTIGLTLCEAIRNANTTNTNPANALDVRYSDNGEITIQRHAAQERNWEKLPLIAKRYYYEQVDSVFECVDRASEICGLNFVELMGTLYNTGLAESPDVGKDVLPREDIHSPAP